MPQSKFYLSQKLAGKCYKERNMKGTDILYLAMISWPTLGVWQLICYQWLLCDLERESIKALMEQ